MTASTARTILIASFTASVSVVATLGILEITHEIDLIPDRPPAAHVPQLADVNQCSEAEVPLSESATGSVWISVIHDGWNGVGSANVSIQTWPPNPDGTRDANTPPPRNVTVIGDSYGCIAIGYVTAGIHNVTIAGRGLCPAQLTFEVVGGVATPVRAAVQVQRIFTEAQQCSR